MHPSITKRQKEQARQRRQQEKAERRANKRTVDRQDPATGDASAEDPDIAGIVPGVQPPPEED
jgi:hypothetical protein